jgi:repressor LexA
VDYLYGISRTIYCPICHQSYDPLNKSQSEDHRRYHDGFVKATEKYGELLPYGEASDLRDNAIRKFRNPYLPSEERIAAFDSYLKYDYMEQVYASRFEFKLYFEEYCEKEASTLMPDALVSIDLCNEIKKKYNVPGIESNRMHEYPNNKSQVNSHNEPYKIPVVRRVAAGIPLDSIEEIIDWEELPAHMALTGNYFGLLIQGNSMEPDIHDGDTVIVREQPNAEDGDVVVAIVNGNDGCCKKLKKYEDGSIALTSINPSYPPIYFNDTEIDNVPVRICGVVKELRRKF